MKPRQLIETTKRHPVERTVRGQAMAQPNGTGGKGPCPYCGQRYTYNNYMRRSGEKAVYDQSLGKWLTDTHLIACHKKSVPSNG